MRLRRVNAANNPLAHVPAFFFLLQQLIHEKLHNSVVCVGRDPSTELGGESASLAEKSQAPIGVVLDGDAPSAPAGIPTCQLVFSRACATTGARLIRFNIWIEVCRFLL